MKENGPIKDSLKGLIYLGTLGHFPLFNEIWKNKFSLQNQKSNKLSGNQRAKIQLIFENLKNCKTFEEKKIMLNQLEEEDKILFVKAFLNLVENKILDKEPEIH